MGSLAGKRVMAERHVRDSRRIVTRQRALVLTLTGQTRMRAESLLVAFERSQALFEDDLAVLIQREIQTETLTKLNTSFGSVSTQLK
jgi:hypothetical protein